MKIAVRWSDVDQNQHVRHSAYYDYGAHCRIQFFRSIGFTNEKFKDLKIGPILFHEACHFIKELKLGETISINVLGGTMRPDGSHWTLYHEIFNEAGQKAAHIKIQGAWMDLNKRKITTPPVELAEAFGLLAKGEDYHYKK